MVVRRLHRERHSPGKGRKSVLIDASPVTGSVDGLAVYIVNLIKNLPDGKLSGLDFTVLLNPEVHWPDLEAAMERKGIRQLRTPIASIGPRRDWQMYRFLRGNRDRFDLIHVTSNNYPLALRGGICTIHDVTFKRWFANKTRIPFWATAARLYMDLVIRLALKRAKAVIAVSDATRHDLATLFSPTPAQLAKVRVIHEGWEHVAETELATQEPRELDASGYLLFLGSHREHKNLARLLEGFRCALGQIPNDRILVVSGSSGQMSTANADLVAAINAERERIVFTGYVSNARVRQLYRHADAFIFPSLSEGFGLPLLEAFYFGTPVLCSNNTALPEVAGDAALYFDPFDVQDIARAIIQYYDDPSQAARLSAAGTRRLDLFSWKKTAEETVALYQQCLGLAQPMPSSTDS